MVRTLETEKRSNEKNIFLRDVTLITALCILLFGFMLGSRPLSAPDEGRYTEIPREMVASGDYVTPRLNGVKYFEKPPLMYWLGAASIKVWGVNEWALRFWPAFFGLLTVLGVYTMGYAFTNRQGGLYAAGILATSLLFYAHTRILILDMVVSTFLSLGLFLFLLSTHDKFIPKLRFGCLMGFFACSAGAVMSKGLIGIVLPGGIILMWTLLTQEWRALRSAFHPLGILLFLILTAPWHVLASLKNPEFFDFYFIHEHFTRYLAKVHNRYQPVWFFIPLVLIGFFPWTPLVLQAWWQGVKKGKQDKNLLFLGVWAAFIFLFFSFSHSKLIPYILPVFPPLALMAGLSLGHTDGKISTTLLKTVGGASLLLMMALPLAAYGYGLIFLREISVILVGLLGILGMIAYLALRRPYDKVFVPLTSLSALFLMLLNSAWPYLDTRSVKELAHEILRHQQPGERVVAFGRYYQDLPPYLNQTISVVDWRGELDFGMNQEDTSAWMLSREDFFRLYQREEKLYIVSRKELVSELEKAVGKLRILKTSLHDVVMVPVR